MHLNLKTILNYKEKHSKFILTDSRFVEKNGETIIQLKFEPRKKSKGICSGCGKSHSCYDHLKERSFKHVNLWGIATEYIYRMRRLNCPTHGVIVEQVP